MTQATARVTKSLAKNLRRRGALPAFLTALGLLLFLVVQFALSTLVNLITLAQAIAATDGLNELSGTTSYWQSATVGLLTTAIPFAFGFFVSLWILAPISDELALRFVIARGILAGGVGIVVFAIVALVLAFVATIEGNGTGSTLGYAFPWEQLGSFGFAAVSILTTALTMFITYLPHVILAAVLLWHWLRTHERSHSVSGILDEV